LMWAVMVFAMGFLMPAVNNWAHGGGFAGGYLVSLALLPHVHRAESPRMRLTALLLALLCVASILVSVVTIFTRMI
jgi:rhomboid protease GluP